MPVMVEHMSIGANERETKDYSLPSVFSPFHVWDVTVKLDYSLHPSKKNQLPKLYLANFGEEKNSALLIEC